MYRWSDARHAESHCCALENDINSAFLQVHRVTTQGETLQSCHANLRSRGV